MNRRRFLLATPLVPFAWSGSFAAAGDFEITRTEAEWRSMLSDAEFRVMREDETEVAGSSPLDKLFEPGTYHCRGCDLPLYPSKTKYESGTGWPSFNQSLPNAIGTAEDNTLFTTRTEAHCRRCGSHLGHIFEDGPKPTGKRHCLNGVSLVFKPA